MASDRRAEMNGTKRHDQLEQGVSDVCQITSLLLKCAAVGKGEEDWDCGGRDEECCSGQW